MKDAIHVIPADETTLHDLSTECVCGPAIDYEDRPPTVAHKSVLGTLPAGACCCGTAAFDRPRREEE